MTDLTDIPFLDLCSTCTAGLKVLLKERKIHALHKMLSCSCFTAATNSDGTPPLERIVPYAFVDRYWLMDVHDGLHYPCNGTLLFWCSFCCVSDAVELLLTRYNASPLGRYGSPSCLWVALMYPSECVDKYCTVEALVRAAPHLVCAEEPTLYERYPLMLAMSDTCHESFTCARILLDAGASIDVAGEDGTRPIHYVAGSLHPTDDVAMLVLRHPSTDFNAVSAEQETPLDFAVTRRNAAMVTFLIARGVDPFASGTQALQSAVRAVLKNYAYLENIFMHSRQHAEWRANQGATFVEVLEYCELYAVRHSSDEMAKLLQECKDRALACAISQRSLPCLIELANRNAHFVAPDPFVRMGNSLFNHGAAEITRRAWFQPLAYWLCSGGTIPQQLVHKCIVVTDNHFFWVRAALVAFAASVNGFSAAVRSQNGTVSILCANADGSRNMLDRKNCSAIAFDAARTGFDEYDHNDEKGIDVQVQYSYIGQASTVADADTFAFQMLVVHAWNDRSRRRAIEIAVAFKHLPAPLIIRITQFAFPILHFCPYYKMWNLVCIVKQRGSNTN